jgi:hypothetical protein
MWKFKIALYVIFLSLFSLNCSRARNVVHHVEALGIDDRNVNSEFVLNLFKLGKRSIPYLIERISDKEINRYYRLSDPDGPYFFVQGMYKCYGFLYAYIIEIILAKETLAGVDELDNCDFVGSRENLVYLGGVIMKKNRDFATWRDLTEIQKVYRTWWRKNKNKSLQQMRKDWWDDKRPLSKSRFYWK